MSNFLLIVPEGWQQLDYDAVSSIPGVVMSALMPWAAANQLENLTVPLQEAGLIPLDKVVTDVKVLDSFVAVLLG